MVNPTLPEDPLTPHPSPPADFRSSELPSNLFTIDSQRELVFADVTGNGLVKMGADARLSSGSYLAARQWAQVIYDHPQAVDGIRYRSRHDDDRYCYGIFNRCADELQEKNLGNLLESNPKLLAEILTCYDYGMF